ncbi:hypothetical protein V6Z11_D10G184900 [Gossypium hirsutum]
MKYIIIHYGDGKNRYILHSKRVIIGDIIVSESTSTDMPLGTTIHNIKTTLGRGGQLTGAVGVVAKLIAKEGKSATLKLSFGAVGNVGVNQKSLDRAGSKWRAPIGRKRVVTSWSYPTLGRRSRKRNKYSDNLIFRRQSK